MSPHPPLPRQPPKTIFVDNKRVPFENDEAYQQFLSRARAAGLTEVRGKTEIDQVEVLCMNLDAIHDGQSYTFFPPKVTGQSEALQFKGTFWIYYGFITSRLTKKHVLRAALAISSACA